LRRDGNEIFGSSSRELDWEFRSWQLADNGGIYCLQSQSQNYITTDDQSASLSWYQAPSGAQDKIFVNLIYLRVCWCGVLSPTRRRVCCLQLLLVLASAVILGLESHGTHDRILLSQTRDCPSVRTRSLYLYPPGTGWPSYSPRHWLLSITYYNSQG
jgi:hypothetical protein